MCDNCNCDKCDNVGEPEYKKHFERFSKELDKRFEEFKGILDKRMVKGHTEYGDESFERDASDLLAEIEEEAMDINGWGLILWTKIQLLKDKIRRFEEDVE